MTEPGTDGPLSAALNDRVYIALGCFAALILVYMAIPYDAPAGSSMTRLGVALFTIPQVLVVAGAALVVLRTSGGERRYWSLLMVVGILIFIYELPWSIGLWNGRGLPSSESLFSTTMLILPAGFFAALLVSMNRATDSTPLARARYVLDGIAASTVIFVTYHTLLVRPYFEAAGLLEPLQHLRVSLHATIGVGVLIGLVVNFRGLRSAGWRQWDRLTVVGIGVYAAALAVVPFYSVAVHTTPTIGMKVVEAMLMGGLFLVTGAAISRLRVGSTQPTPVRYESSATAVNKRSAAYQIVMLGALGTLAIAAVRVGDTWPDSHLYLGSALLICALLGVRTVIDASDTGAFFRRSITDPVSGARTYRFFRERLQDEVELCSRCAEPLAVIVADIDGFRAHAAAAGDDMSDEAADSLLRSAVGAMVPLVGAADTLGRIEGDRFAVLLVGANRGWAMDVAEGMRHAVRSTTGMTLSAGVALFPEHGLEASELYAHAERALMWARTRGTDRLAVYDPDLMDRFEPDDALSVLDKRMNSAAIRALAEAVDARDVDTRYHSQGVADLAVQLGRRIGLDPERVRQLESAALVHDVGKIGISDRTLRKRGPLNGPERAEVQQHSALGSRVLAGTTMRDIAPWVRSHHERWDGTGYPDSLAGEEVLLESRILALCDAYDAMTSPRSYRSRLSPAAALQEIDLCMGTQFDPELAEEFIVLVRDRIDPERRYN